LGIEVGPWDAGKIKFVPPAGGLNPEVHNLQIIARKQCGAGCQPKADRQTCSGNEIIFGPALFYVKAKIGVLYVSEKISGVGFSVKVDDSIAADLKFDWLIVETK
jgi:hypothetical protein